MTDRRTDRNGISISRSAYAYWRAIKQGIPQITILGPIFHDLLDCVIWGPTSSFAEHAKTNKRTISDEDLILESSLLVLLTTLQQWLDVPVVSVKLLLVSYCDWSSTRKSKMNVPAQPYFRDTLEFTGDSPQWWANLKSNLKSRNNKKALANIFQFYWLLA